MRRINAFLEDSWVDYLKKLPGTLSEHFRRAVNEYITRIEEKKVSSSQSKGGDGNG